jgi:hypothetical protein
VIDTLVLRDPVPEPAELPVGETFWPYEPFAVAGRKI